MGVMTMLLHPSDVRSYVCAVGRPTRRFESLLNVERGPRKTGVYIIGTADVRMPEQSNDYRVVVFGAGGVGKSSLVLRFVKGTFRESYIPTIEDTYRQVISCNKNICTLQITDTTGSHQFPAMQRLSISKGHAFILVYSVCSRQSFEELRPIWAVIRELKGQEISQIPIMLVGNKCDESPSVREVSMSEGAAEAANWGCGFLETSAKTNHNVNALFRDLLTLEKNRSVSLQPVESHNAISLKEKCEVM
ncbi:GTP-binding protein Di-Ras2 [Vespa velutina]|nr:GTP-binding protein Di-Ras2 [Vespa velutina]